LSLDVGLTSPLMYKIQIRATISAYTNGSRIVGVTTDLLRTH